MKVYISTAERSGSVYARLLKKELEREPGTEVVGGFTDEDLAPVGFAAGFKASARTTRRMREIEREVRALDPDIFLAVAWSEPHIMLGLRLRAIEGMRRIFFAPPQLWAWARWRASLLRKGYDKLLCLYPREARLLKAMGLVACFAGNPLAGYLKPYFDRKRSIKPVKPTVAVLPGSRASEQSRHVDLLTGFSRMWKKAHPRHRIVWLYASEAEAKRARSMIESAENTVGGEARFTELTRADLAIVTSGTACLETALLGTPQVVFYTLSPLETFLAKTFTRVERFALPNLIAGQDVVAEVLNPEARDLMRLGEEAFGNSENSLSLAERIHSELAPLDNRPSFLSMF